MDPSPVRSVTVIAICLFLFTTSVELRAGRKLAVSSIDNGPGTEVPGKYSGTLHSAAPSNGTDVGMSADPALGSARRAGPFFRNVSEERGLSGVKGNFFAWGDYNNDGYQDLLAGSRLFRNDGPPGWGFTETTDTSGLEGGGHGTWADYDNDGNLDVYMVGSNRLWRNQGPEENGVTFTDVTVSSGIDSHSHTTVCGWGDHDDDGFLDLYIGRGEDWNDGSPVYYPNMFYRNNGDGTFSNLTLEAGLDESEHPTYTRGVSWGDYNNDGWLDIYVSNYRQQPNYLYENNGNGTFSEVGAEKGVADGTPRTAGNPDPYDRAGHSVGAVWGDYDNDNDLDLWVTNLNHKDWRTSDDSLLYRNNGPPDHSFTNVREEAGIPIKPYVAPNEGDELFVGCAWDDFNNDGYLDLYLPQVYGDVSYAYSFLYMNDGDGTFTDVTERAGVRVWNTYAASWSDYNNDGSVDLLTAGKYPFENGTYGVRLFENALRKNGSWLKVELTGTDHNSKGMGARVSVKAGDSRYMKEVEGGTGSHGQQNSLPLDFGLSDHKEPVDITVRWGPNKYQNISNADVDQFVSIREPPDRPDMAITDLALSPNKPLSGDPAEIEVRIENSGMRSVSNSTLNIYLDEIRNSSGIGESASISDVESGVKRVVYQTFNTTGVSGAHTLIAAIEDVYPEEDDRENNIARLPILVREFNELPRACLEVNEENPYVGEPVRADGSCSTDDAAVAEYLFDFGDGTVSEWRGDPVSKHEYGEPGRYTISLTVRDTDGAVSGEAAERIVEVRENPNSEPRARILSISPSPAKQGRDVVEFDGEGEDDDGQIVGYRWRSNIDGYLSNLSEFSVDAIALSPGEHTIFLKVRDDAGDWSREKSEGLSVLGPNKRPKAEILGISPSPARKGETIIFKGIGEDGDGTVVGYRWSSDTDGYLSEKKEFSTDALSVGEHVIYFVAVDDEGGASEPDTRTLTVRGPNVAPTCRILSIEPEEPEEGESVILRGEGEDPDGEVAIYEWHSNIDGDLGEGAVAVVEEGLTAGEHLIHLTVIDDSGASSRATTGLNVSWRDLRPELVPESGPFERDGDDRTSLFATVIGLAKDDFHREFRLEFRIDGGDWTSPEEGAVEWEEVEKNVKRWKIRIDVSELGNGFHSLLIRGSDGKHLTESLLLSLNVDHQKDAKVTVEKGEEPVIRIAATALVLLGAVVFLAIYIVRQGKYRKRTK